MGNIGLVTMTGIRTNLRMKTMLTIMVLVTLICTIGVAFLLCFLLIVPEVKSTAPDRGILEGYLGLVLYASSFISVGVTLNSMLFQTIVKEKVRGSMAALMATPMNVSEIWVGKSLAVFIPGLVLSILLTVLSWVYVNVAYFLPHIGVVINVQMIVNSLVAIPLMYLFFGLLVHLVGYIAKPMTGNIIAQVFLPVMINVAAQLIIHGGLEPNSWQFMAMNFGVVALIGILVLALRQRLTPEKVILSS